MKAAVLRNWREDLSTETVADPECPACGAVLHLPATGMCRSDCHVKEGADAKGEPPFALARGSCPDYSDPRTVCF